MRLCCAVLVCAACVAGLSAPRSPAHAAPMTETEAEPSVPRALRTGRATTRSIALLFDSTLLGDIMLRIEPGGTALVPKAALIDMLLPVFGRDKAVITQLERMPEKHEGYVTLAALQAVGFSIGFDSKQMRLARAPAAAPALAKQSPRPSLPPGTKVSLLDMLLTSGGKRLGEIQVQVIGSSNFLLPKAPLIDMLTPLLDGDEAAMARLEAMADADGHVTFAALRAAGFIVKQDLNRLDVRRAAAGAAVGPAAATPVAAPSKPAAESPANAAPPAVGPAGRLVRLKLGGEMLGEVMVRTNAEKAVLLPKAAVIDILMPALGKDALARLEAVPDSAGAVTLDQLKKAGVEVRFTQNEIEFGRTISAAAERPASAAPPIGPNGRLVRLKHGGETLGEIMVRSNGENAVLLPKAALIDMLTPALEKDAGALARLEGVPDSEGQVTLEQLKKAGVEVRLTQNQIEFGPPTADADADPTGYAKTVSSRLNPTGRTITINVPLKEGDTQLGEIVVRIEPDGTVLLPKATLVQQLAPVLDKAALASLQKVPDNNGLVPLGDLSGASFRLAYDPSQLELAFNPVLEQRALSDLSLGRPQQAVSAQLAKPAIMSGYLNMIGGADHRWDETGATSLHFGKAETTSLYLDLQSAVYVAGVVIENEASFEGEIDPQQCPSGASCVYQHEAGFKRRRSRLVYDLPEQLVRVALGDVEQPVARFQRGNDVLGLTLEKSPRKLAPGESIRPTGRGSFSIERAADVEVLINGAVTQRLHLKPGNYNIRDLPLSGGANDVELVITDDRGARRTVAFSTFSDGNMLAAGKSEWALSGGIGSYFIDGERAYRPDDYLANSFVRYGVTDGLTVETQAKGDMHVIEGGVGILTATRWGSWGLHGAASNSDLGLGFAANVNWDLVNFRGLLGSWRSERESLRLAAEYRSTEFRTPGEFATTASGILYPQSPYRLRLSGAYAVPIAWGATASVVARYQFADPEQVTLSPLIVEGDRYGADITLSGPLGRALSASLTAGYSNEATPRSLADLQQEESPELRVMARLFVRPDNKSRVSASYDSLNNLSYVSAYRGEGRGLDRWEGDVSVQNDGDEHNAMANGSLAYSGNRGEVRLAHLSNFEDVGWDQASPTSKEQRSSVRVGTAVAFAGSHVAIGQPVRGGAFAIVHPHESLAGKEVTVGADGDVRARANGLGPALVPDLPVYARNTIPVDVTGLPVGYSLGAGGFDVVAPYRAGYALEVGSANSVSAYGTLLLADFSPVALLTGVAHPADNPLQQVSVFTNKAGRFAAEGLSPGKWVIEMATEGEPTRYEIEVPQGTDGIFQAGILSPVGAAQDG